MTSRRQILRRLETRADRFERIVAQALRRSLRAGTKDLGVVAAVAPLAVPITDSMADQIRLMNAQGTIAINSFASQPAEPYVSLDDLAAIEAAWQRELRELILPQLGMTLVEGAQDAIEDLVIKAPVLVDSRHAAGELYLSQAENRLHGIGNSLWQNTRTELVQGMAEGESIPQLAKRVRQELAAADVRARTIARTEVISASNAGALAQMNAMGEAGPAEKEWLATNDARTRLSHREANGQTVALPDQFEVGGSMLAFPGDPSGPPDEVINCRCTLTWNMEASTKLVAAGFQADDEPHTSGMIALVPADPPSLPGGEPADESHLTLWFLGDTADITPELQKNIMSQVEARATDISPVEANAFGAAVWNPLSEDPCVVLNVGGDGLADRRHAFGQSLVQAVADAGVSWEMPQQHDPWVPHVCLAYDDHPEVMVSQALELTGPMLFDRVRVAFGDEIHDYELGGPVTASGWEHFPIRHDPKDGRFAPGEGEKSAPPENSKQYGPVEARKFIEEGWADWRGDLSTNEKGTVASYAFDSSGSHRRINKHLRSGESAESKPRLEQQTKNLDGAFAHPSARMPADAVVHRGLTGPIGIRLDNARKEGILDGARIEDPAFTSTSLTPSVASRFSKGSNPAERVMLHIHLKKGDPAIGPGPMAKQYQKEHEIILPRNQGYTVRRSQRRGGVLHIDMEMER